MGQHSQGAAQDAQSEQVPTSRVPGTRRVRRDRHSRGLRGPVLPHNVPSYESRREIFNNLVKTAIEEIDERIGEKLKGSLASVEFSVDQIPNDIELKNRKTSVPLGRNEASGPTKPAKIVLYRRPIELRGTDEESLGRIIRDVLAENIGALVGMNPNDVDPEYQGPDQSS